MTETYFTGSIERVIFENPSNFFKILLLAIEESNSDIDDVDIIVTGTIAEVVEGEQYTFFGQLVQHPKYGQQLQVSRYERSRPSQAGLVKYFSSDHFKGIGRKTAQKIVDLYGSDPIDRILAEPEKLTEITGLSARNRQSFVDKLRLNYGTERLLAQLATYGISPQMALKIQETYKEESVTILEENPYQLVEDIQGIGFTLADTIAAKLGMAADSPRRFRAALLHTLLHRSMETGDTYLEARELLEQSILLLETARPIELNPAHVADQLTSLIEDGRVQQIETKIFDNSLFFAEEGIAKHLSRLLNQTALSTFESQDIVAAIQQVEEEMEISYDMVQKQAIADAICQPVFILTGGPGTGKTTIINGIIAVYAKLHQINLQTDESPILLAAPTGRAARRMTELTGLSSATIHRHLGLVEGQEEAHLSDYLEAEFIIVDEFSMVDTWLANQLLTHISSATQLLIVGDAEQLPSVSPGQVLTDLLSISSIPHITLETIYRQSEDSTIVTLASEIRKGSVPADFHEKKADRSYFEANKEQIPALVERIVSAAVSSGISAEDVQVLAPMYRGVEGIHQLNTHMQALLNPSTNSTSEFAYQQLIFRTGDRVLHLVNDATQNVFNGDLGYITRLSSAQATESKQDEISIDFDGNLVTYPRNEWYKLTLAYAMSIHKSQGSEFPVVILPLTRTSQRMLQRNLLYTAITRAKSKLVLLGDRQAFHYAVAQTGTGRHTYLPQRFDGDRLESVQTPDVKTTYLLTEENCTTIDPMIGVREADIRAFFGTSSQKD